MQKFSIYHRYLTGLHVCCNMVEGSKEKDSVKSKNSHQDVFCKNGVLKSFAIYKRKCLHWSRFLIKLQVFSMQLHLKNLLRYKCFTVSFAKLLIVFYIHPSTTASENALDFTKNISVFKASCEKEFVLFSFFRTFLFIYSRPDPGLGENKLVLVWNIVRYFYLSCFRRVVNSTLDGTFLWVCYKKHIS